MLNTLPPVLNNLDVFIVSSLIVEVNTYSYNFSEHDGDDLYHSFSYYSRYL